jgi:hypothetical protein
MNNCYKCDINCLTCNGPSYNNCLSCDSWEKALMAVSNICMCNYGANNWTTGMCEYTCQLKGCINCTSNSSTCLACNHESYLINGECFCNKSSHYFGIVNNLYDHHCYPCHFTCLTCNGPS